jgi:hypothetical protein
MDPSESYLPDLTADCLSHLGSGAPLHHAFPGSSCADWMESSNGPNLERPRSPEFLPPVHLYEPIPASLER